VENATQKTPQPTPAPRDLVKEWLRLAGLGSMGRLRNRMIKGVGITAAINLISEPEDPGITAKSSAE